MTTATQIEKASNVAAAIRNIQGVTSCWVDDFKDGSFSVFATFQRMKHINMRSLTNAIRKACRAEKDLSLNYVTPPKRTYRRSWGEKIFDGYESNRIEIDFDIRGELEVVTPNVCCNEAEPTITDATDLPHHLTEEEKKWW